MMLADAITWGQIGVFSTIAATAVAVAAYFSRSRVEISPQPFEVKAAEQFARKHELDRLETLVTTAARDREKKDGLMHEKINSVDRKVAALERATDLQNDKLSVMDEKLDGMPDRMIATLKNTGAI